jgi:FkbM family methyltransferase
MKKLQYYSQVGQDKFLNEELFHSKKNGVFIDIGANDGVKFSNSYFFEKELGWTGICIEPHPEAFKRLQSSRTCVLENCAISDVEGMHDFTCIEGFGEMLSGFNREEIAEYTISKEKGKYTIIQVQTFRLDTILNKHNIKSADFCSIDVETKELDVVKSIDWNEYDIKYLCVEANPEYEKIIEYLEPYYTLVKKVESDLMFKKNE